MNKIPVYEYEIKAGLQEKIQANNSLAYVTSAKKAATIAPSSLKIAKASITDLFDAKAALHDADLYFFHSILVSSVWNKNDEVFLKDEMIKAKNTPIYKKVNLNHDETKIVGTMVAACVVDDDGNPLDEETLASEDCPSPIHILNSAVVYRRWEGEELGAAVAGVIEKIEADEQCVSMECLFSDYDYCVMNTKGECQIVKRNAETAFLTSALRIYGGSGEYKNYKIARVLRNLIFSGVGFVDKPANPDSVTFTADSITNFITASENLPFLPQSGVSFNREDTEVSNTQESENIMANDTTDVVERLTTEKVNLEATIATLTSEKTVLTDKVSSLEASVASLTANVTTLTASVETLTTEKAAIETAKAEIETSYNEIQAKVTEQARVTTLVGGGLTPEEAQAKVKDYAFATEEQFNSIAQLIIAAHKPATPAPAAKTEAEVEQANADTQLDTAEVQSEPALTVAADTTKQALESTRAGLVEFARQSIGTNKKKK